MSLSWGDKFGIPVLLFLLLQEGLVLLRLWFAEVPFADDEIVGLSNFHDNILEMTRLQQA